MTTLEMQISVMNHFDIRRNLIVDNVTDMSLLVAFETDILVLSGSGYATGIEIKVSKGDLKNDLKKKQWKYLDDFKAGKSYHEIYFGAFKKFYYAVPEKLQEAALKQIPEWCGLLVCERYPKLEEVRSPKLLFNNKWSDKERYQLARLGTMRIYRNKINLLSSRKSIQ